MESVYPALLVVFVLLLLLGSGSFICVALGASGLLSLFLFSKGKAILASLLAWNVSNSFVLSCVPIFLFMGEVIFLAGISSRLYTGFNSIVGKVPGRLLHSNILSCALFAAMCGSSVATAATIGTVAIPELEKRGYSPRYILGSLAAGGTLGILIPPSIPMVLYAVMVGESVGQLFIAGFIPGLLLSLLFMIYIGISAWRNPQIAPQGPPVPFRLQALVGFLPSLFLVFVVLGSMFFGIATPTEAAALGALGAIFLSLAFRSLSFNALKESLLSAARTTSMLVMLMVGATILAFALADLGVLENITRFALSLEVRPIFIMMGIYILYLILGCFFDPVSMMVMTLPVVFPVVSGLGHSAIWFGIILVVLIEAGLLTPPVGLNVFVIHGIAKGHSLDEVFMGSLPFVAIMILLLVLLSVFPALALWLPGLMIQR